MEKRARATLLLKAQLTYILLGVAFCESELSTGTSHFGQGRRRETVLVTLCRLDCVNSAQIKRRAPVLVNDP